MKLVDEDKRSYIAPLFHGWNETMILSCIQGYMGQAWADRLENPQSAQIVVGDFCFFAGVPNRKLVENIPVNFPSPCILMIPQHTGWSTYIENTYQERFDKFMRYSTKKEPQIFDSEKLLSYQKKIPPNYQLQKIDQCLYHTIPKIPWAKDLCAQFSTWEAYKMHGMGYVVTHHDKIVSGASSYTAYNGGIEIQIDTRQDYRRQGFALACASALILHCLEKGIYPSWDAANHASLCLAQKLGYHLEKAYVTYAVSVN